MSEHPALQTSSICVIIVAVCIIGSVGWPSAEAGALVLPEDLLLVELDAHHFIFLGLRNSCIAGGVLPRSLRKAFLMVKGSFTVVYT